MSLSPDQLKQILADADHPLGIKELLRLAGLHPGQQTELKRALRELVRKGDATKDGKRFVAMQAPTRRGDGGADVRPPNPWQQKGPPAGRAPQGSQPQGFRARGREPERPGRDFGRGRDRRPSFGQDGGGRGGFRKGGGAERFSPRGRRGGDLEDSGLPTVEGILHVHRDGFGFVHPVSGEGENIFLPPGEAQRALDNDRVVVRVSGRPGRYEGELLRVVTRRRELAVGTYTVQGRHGLVLPTDTSLPGPIRVPLTQMAQEGDLVKVRLGVGAQLLDPSKDLFGEVAGSLGKPGEPSAEVLATAFSQGFSDEFPPEVMDEADRFSVQVAQEEARGEVRRDLRSMPLITIDGEDARDFDDAVYTEPHGSGWRLVVAIADVTHYVREGTALNAEGLRRATSVYLPDRVLPMLPERLSNGICSLKPDEDRLCMVADMTFDRQGQRLSSELYPAVMRSAARCTYNEVQDVLDGKDVPHRNAFKPQFEQLMALARVLTKMRKERGAIDFDLPEHKVVLGKDGLPVRMDKRERKDSHRLIEECMLAANEAVARFFNDEGLPTVYRFHGEPDPEKLANFAALAQAYGFKLRFEDGVTSKELDAFVSQLAGHPEQRALNQLLLRSMMQAVYTPTRVGHYGLAAEHYLHFTSPIRRYPDLLVHRLLKAHWARKGRKPTESMLEREETQLEDMAVQCSERERAAMQVEREVVSFYACLLLKDRVGEEFAATVAAITDFGFFVELDEVHVEGLVKAETLGPSAKLDKLTHSLVYAGGRRVRVGQKLRVRLSSVNPSARKIDFEALQFEGEAPLARAEGGAPKRRREWEAEAPRGQGHERAGRPGRREREGAPPWQKGPREEPARAGPRGRFVREGRREEAAPSRAGGSRFQRPWNDEGAKPATGPDARLPQGPKRRMFLRPEHPSIPPTEGEERQPLSQGPENVSAPEVQEAQTPVAPWEFSGGAAEAGGDEGSRSPHPGFDRIRALASQRKGGRPDARGASHHKPKPGQGRPNAQVPRPPAPEARPMTAESGPAAPEASPAAVEPRTVAPESRHPVPESRPVVSESRPSAVEARPAAAETRPAAHRARPTAHTDEAAPTPPARVSAAPEPVSDPEAGSASPVVSEEAPVRGPKRKAASKKTTAGTRKGAASRKQPAKAVKKAAKKAAAKVAKKAAGKAAKKPAKASAPKAPKARVAKTAKTRTAGGKTSSKKTAARRKR
ncbi:ribonuclease R [Pyxidicoccus xibeiensis]|uniref:ribonuclease R n=1 Tax=Pyxidicoccus xibeiensis TaxID=2906759 RepID=UPI0020A6E174|nr:ribonuclease R [Pyxidicoccus xibeiensis]MCP3137738.1 ribonuclease R [Pyxidicoccus xibeiensis]